MYESYWNLKESPFRESGRGVVHHSPQHEEALARLLFLVEDGRTCGLLTGLEGTGKSLVLRLTAEQARRSGIRCVVVDAGNRDADDLVADLLIGLSAVVPVRTQDGRNRLHDILTERHKYPQPLLLVFDQLQEAMDEVGPLLHSLVRTARTCGNVTCLFAQRSPLLPTAFSWLADGAELHASLTAFDRKETQQFVTDLLRQTGGGDDVFLPDAVAAVQEFSEGIPRKIRRLCDLSLLSAMQDSAEQIDAAVVCQAHDNL